MKHYISTPKKPFYKNYFEDKTGSKAIVQNKKDKFKVILNFNSSTALKEFVEKIN